MTRQTPTRDELQRSLQRLHEELAGAPRVDESSRRLLQEVLADIQRLLKAPPTAPRDPAVDTAAHRLQNLAVEFESRHPILAGSVRQFVDLLGRAGL